MQRITTLGTTTSRNQWLNNASRSVSTNEERIATGLRFNRASQAPADAAALLRNQQSLGRLEQLDRNVANARMWLNTTDTALSDTVNTLTRARTLTIQGANGTNTVEGRTAIAADLRSAAEELLGHANTTVNGRPIFSGTAGTTQAYDLTGTYLGDAGAVVRAISPTESFSVGAAGPNVFGAANPGDPYAGSAYEVLMRAADAVEAGDTAGARAGIEAIDVATSRVQRELGRIGGLSSRLDQIEEKGSASQLATRAQISEIQDVDLAEALVHLQTSQTKYEATLSAAGRSLGRSLLDFLR